jgi:hypothetical protein
MLSRPVLLCVLCIAFGAVAPVSADKPRLSQDELRRQADVILVGKVQSYRTQSRVFETEERTRVLLDVLVEFVEKGKPDAEVGQTIQIRCDRLTRPSPLMLATHIGNEPFPAPDGRARFYLERQSAIAPNGVELLDGAAELDLPMKDPWIAFIEWPLVLLPAAGLVLLLLIIAYFDRGRAKRAASRR